MNNSTLNHQICSHQRALERFAMKFTGNRSDADDLVQDTIMRALSFADLYKEGTNLRAWLYTIMKNTFINNFRKETKCKKIMDSVGNLSSCHLADCASTNQGENKFIHDDITIALRNLDTTYSGPFIKHCDGYKYQEIADELNIPMGTVKTRIHVAKQILQNSLKMYTEDYYKKKNCN